MGEKMERVISLKDIISFNGNFKTAINLYLSLNKTDKVLGAFFLFILFRIYFRIGGEILFCFCFCLKQRYIIIRMNGSEAKGTAGCARNHTGIAIVSNRMYRVR